MNPIVDGGPAFPVADPMHLEPKNVDEMKRLAKGMSLRDYFAIHSGADDLEISPESAEVLMGRPAPVYTDDLLGCLKFWAEVRSKLRYIEADSMIAARGAA